MALIDQINQFDIQKTKAAQKFASQDIDWGLLASLGWDVFKEALAEKVWGAIKEDPKQVIFRLKINTQVWFIPIKLNWKVRAGDLGPVIKWILGDPPG